MIPAPGENEAHVIAGSPCLDRSGKYLVLEEYEFSRTGEAVSSPAEWIANYLLPEGNTYAMTRKRFPSHCVLLNNDNFTHFARHATEITARVGLNYETKTVRDGALFYQEFLPAETLFYSVLLANPARSRTDGLTSGEILEFLRVHCPRIVQIGGDETTGKGFCATRLTTSKAHEVRP
jgi:CRISPR-associated protein Cmr4